MKGLNVLAAFLGGAAVGAALGRRNSRVNE